MIFLTPYILEDPKAAANMTTSIISDGQQLSPAEIGTLMKNHEGYQKSISNEGVTKEMLDPYNIISQDKQEEKKDDWKSRYNELVREMEAKEKDQGK